MAEESKDPAKQPSVVQNEESEAEEVIDSKVEDSAALADPSALSLKKKIKKKLKKASGGASSESGSGSQLSTRAVGELLEKNPQLQDQIGGMDKAKALEMLKKMDLGELLTGMSLNGKNQKDMSNHKFWATQPVRRFDDKADAESGPISVIKPEEVRKEPYGLPKGYEWCTLDLEKENEVKELYELLTFHYVEDDNAMFRFKYSQSFLNWALRSPGWKREWHVGVRTSESKKLVASICGVPTRLRVRNDVVPVTEINFLCIHKRLRSQRLAPMLIREVTRRCYLEGIYQAVYTAGVVLPTPVSSCRYYHRSLDWLKLYEVGFSPLPPNSTKARMISRNQLPGNTSTPGLRPMEKKDVTSVLDLLNRFLERYEFAQELTADEIEHWLVNAEKPEDQVVYSFVVEQDGKITDFTSFYSLESSVIKKEKYESVKAAYLFYYASESVFKDGPGAEKQYKERLTTLMQDALIEAKRAKFDVFNALTLHDNPLFLEQLKFGAGDGMLHYYLYNYRTPPIVGGINERNLPDEKKMGGVGMVLL